MKRFLSTTAAVALAFSACTLLASCGGDDSAGAGPRGDVNLTTDGDAAPVGQSRRRAPGPRSVEPPAEGAGDY